MIFTGVAIVEIAVFQVFGRQRELGFGITCAMLECLIAQGRKGEFCGGKADIVTANGAELFRAGKNRFGGGQSETNAAFGFMI